MRIARQHIQRLALCAALAAAAVSPAAAQSQLDASQAREFLGTWSVPLMTDMGNMTLQLEIADKGGKVAATFGAPDMGTVANVTDITRNGAQLHMNLFIDAQGQSIDIALDLAREGEELNVSLSAMGGSFTTSAKGTKTAS